MYNGLAYKGRLVDITDQEIHVQTREQWLSLPLDGVTSVKKAPDSGWNLNRPGESGETS
jgi:hypothetical protein